MPAHTHDRAWFSHWVGMKKQSSLKKGFLMVRQSSLERTRQPGYCRRNLFFPARTPSPFPKFQCWALALRKLFLSLFPEPQHLNLGLRGLRIIAGKNKFRLLTQGCIFQGCLRKKRDRFEKALNSHWRWIIWDDCFFYLDLEGDKL